MSIRDELLDHAARERYGSAYTDYPKDHPITRSIREEVARIVDPILARFAVVELPDGPTGITYTTEHHEPFPPEELERMAGELLYQARTARKESK